MACFSEYFMLKFLLIFNSAFLLKFIEIKSLQKIIFTTELICLG